MKDRADVQRAKARAMMGGDMRDAGMQRKSMGSELGGRPAPAVGVVAKGPPDRYVRPAAPIQSERPAMLARGGKVAARMAESRGMERKKANDRVAESRGMERKEKRADAAQDRNMMRQFMKADEKKDKKMVAGMIGKHEGHLHKGQPRTKFASGGKVKRDPEAIEFTGQELKDMDGIRKLDGNGARAGMMAGRNQMTKGKSAGAAKDAEAVMSSQNYKRGGRVCKAMGGAAKVRQGWGQKVPKMPKGGDPQY